ncbi:MAG: hypothetical protein ABH840_04155 [Nanoarchaeota archaeon]
MKGFSGIGCVAGDREPVSELSLSGGLAICFDGNVINCSQLKTKILYHGASFSGHRNPEDVQDVAIISKVIARESSFEKGIARLVDSMQGDFAVVGLSREGVYAARGWGRKPLILGKKDGSYAVSSESNSFPNNGISILRDVEPGEVVLLNSEGVHTLRKFKLEPVKFGTFEWIYTAYPPSVIDGRCVADVRMNIGAALAKRYPVEADLVSPIPNSGRWHAAGYARESGINSEEVFVRYDYSDRSYTPQEQEDRDEEARTKLIPIESRIKGKRIVIVDDSIVRGTQMLNRVKALRELGAEKVHLRIACPPLMAACQYGKTTKKNEDCIARRMSVQDIKRELGVDSLEYALVDDLESSIGISRDKLCLQCWNS